MKAVAGKSLDKLAGVPVLITQEHGRGKAIYLNFFLTSYVEERRDAKEGKWKQLLGHALREAGVQPEFRVLTSGGRPLDGFEQISFSSGSARYLGLLKNEEIEARTSEMTVQLDKAYHVYDARTKKYHGITRSIRDSIRTAEPKLYALLPVAVSGVMIAAERPARRGARFGYKVVVDAGEGVNPIVVMRVYRPDGTLAREYSENLEAKGGAAAAGFHLALNDPVGLWKLVAIDVASGKQATLAFTLQ